MSLVFCKSPSDTEDIKGGTQKDALFITLPCNLQSQCTTKFYKIVCRSMNLNPAETWKRTFALLTTSFRKRIMWSTCVANLCEHCTKWICHLSCKVLDFFHVDITTSRRHDITTSWPCVSLIEHVRVCEQLELSEPSCFRVGAGRARLSFAWNFESGLLQ